MGRSGPRQRLLFAHTERPRDLELKGRVGLSGTVELLSGTIRSSQGRTQSLACLSEERFRESGLLRVTES